MILLTSRRLAAALAARAQRRLLERRIRRPGLVRVVAVLRQARLQLADALEQLGDLFRLLGFFARNCASSASLLSEQSAVDGGLGMPQTYIPGKLFGKST
jgi:hypothetical protein